MALSPSGPRFSKTDTIVRYAVLGTLAFLILQGLLSVLLPICPFRDDEMRIVYNLKFKSPAELWGKLEFMQEFPRVYLQLFKGFTHALHYSYFGLRFPSFVVGTLLIFFGYGLSRRLYPAHSPNRLLFLLIIVSSFTFTQYYVQVKQYTMEMLLCLLALWQMLQLAELRKRQLARAQYLLLCLSFLLAPYFSYTYPVVIAPVMLITVLGSLLPAQDEGGQNPAAATLKIWLPLLLCVASIVVFYIIDVRHLMKDSDMRQFWGHLMWVNGFKPLEFAVNFYYVFAQVGAGLLFATIFGILGIVSFFYGISLSLKSIIKKQMPDPLVFYSTLLLLLAVMLNLLKKLPLAEQRLNAFMVPAIAILIIHFLNTMQARDSKGYSRWLSLLLYAGVAGNIFTTYQAYFFSNPSYTKRMNIYNATRDGINLAQKSNMPIYVTPGVAFPYDTTNNMPYLERVPGDWILKVHPAYSAAQAVAVVRISDIAEASKLLSGLPGGVDSAVAGDGLQYKVVYRNTPAQ